MQNEKSHEWWIVIATGPSLRCKDVQALRGVGLTVAINCAVFYAPWADFLFAADNAWWHTYGPMVAWYKGPRISKTCVAPGIERWHGKGWPRTGGNSGHMGVQVAVDKGATHVAIYGFDQQKTDGLAHCHADHPKTMKGKRTNMGNAVGIAAWPRLMAATAVDLKRCGVRVVNLSRETALDCFERMSVEEFLEMARG